MSAEEQLTVLKQKIEVLETKLNQQTAGGSTGTASPGQITIKVRREHKLRRITGGRDDGVLEQWSGDTKLATDGHAKADAIDFLLMSMECSTDEGHSPETFGHLL